MFKRNLSLSASKVAGQMLHFFKTPRRLIKVLLFAVISFSPLFFFGCSGKGQEKPREKPENKIHVLSTTSMIGDLVVQIGGDLIEHSTLISGDIDPHNYELVKGDDELFTSSEILFCHGDNLEHGASLHSQIHSHPHAVKINEAIEKKHPELMITLPEGGVDPHLWLDASLWASAIDPIADHLSLALPQEEAKIRENAKALKDEILNTDRWILEKMGEVDTSKKFLVSTHDAFRYFSRHYLTPQGEDFNQRAVAPEGVAPEGQIGFQQIRNMVDFVIGHEIPYLFQENNLRADSLKKICSVCASKGIKVKIFPQKLFADTTGNAEIGKGAYVNMMKSNANALLSAWKENQVE